MDSEDFDSKLREVEENMFMKFALSCPFRRPVNGRAGDFDCFYHDSSIGACELQNCPQVKTVRVEKKALNEALKVVHDIKEILGMGFSDGNKKVF